MAILMHGSRPENTLRCFLYSCDRTLLTGSEDVQLETVSPVVVSYSDTDMIECYQLYLVLHSCFKT